MFADKPNAGYKLPEYQIQRLPLTLDIYQAIPKEFVNPIRIVSDPCNLSIAYDPPEESSYWGGWRLPKIGIEIRNSYCSPPPQKYPETTQFPVSPDNKCAMVLCRDGRLITTVLIDQTSIIPYNPQFATNSEAQTVANYEYNYSLEMLKRLYGGNLPGYVRNLTITIDSAAERAARTGSQIKHDKGFVPQLRGGSPYRLKIIQDGVVSIQNDIYKIDEYGDPIGNIEYATRFFRVQYDNVEQGSHADTQVGRWIVTRFKKSPCIPNIVPPPPPPKKECCKMDCCPDNSQLEALLRLVLKRIGGLPINVPASYLTRKGKQPTATKSVPSLMELTAWFAERFDEVIGEFEVTVKIDDVDPTKKGQQPKTLHLPNLSEAIAEMFTLQLQQSIHTDLILNIATRVLVESGQIKQTEFKSYNALMALIDYIGFHHKNSSQKMPLSFVPGEKSFENLLKEIEVDVPVIEYHEKDTFSASLYTLLQAAAITRAVHFRKVPLNAEGITAQIKKDLSQLMGDTGDLNEKIKKYLKELDYGYDFTTD